MRQRPDRYTIRAGRNLPDKEFRYLRTVIVTAAIHQGLNSMLRTEVLTSPFDLLALGRHHTIYCDLMSLHSAVFLINSRLGHFSATGLRSFREGNHIYRFPFSRSYGDNLPSSLTRVHSRALEYSSHPPVSVLVRSPSTTRIYFLETPSRSSFHPRVPLESCQNLCKRIYLSTLPTTLRTLPIVRTVHSFRQSFVIVLGGAGIFNLLPIAYAFRPQLRGRLTQGRRALPWKP